MQLEPDIHIRKVEEKDNKVLAAIIRRSLEEFDANKPGTVYFDEATDTMHQNFLVKNASYFVLEEDGQLAGGCGFYPTEGLPPETCELVKMYLGTKFRQKGYGQLLLNKSMAEASLAGYSSIYIETLPELKNAIELYKKNGFHFIEKPLGNSGHSGCDVWMLKNI